MQLEKSELLGGITSFFATMYIIIVNPLILSKCGMPFDGVLTATIMVAFISTLLMGLYAKNPIVLAPGMGINAFFTFSVVIGMKVPWQQALGATFWSGIIFIFLSLFNVRTKILQAIPNNVRYGVAVGIGLFIAFLGLKSGGLIQADPVTFVKHAQLSASVIIFLIGLFITALLVIKKIPGAFILSILITSLLSLSIGSVFEGEKLIAWKGIWSMPSFELFGQMDLIGSLKLSILPVVFSLLFADLFDSLATFVAVAEAGELTDENGDPKNVSKSLLVDAIGTTISGIFGTSSATSFIESAAGIKAGGSTGMVAVVAAFCFLPFLFLSPLLSMIPVIATAPVLVVVGVMMTSSIVKINWEDFKKAFPAFLSIILIPLTFSISSGIIWGYLSFFILALMHGEIKKLKKIQWLISILCIASLYFRG